MRRNYLKLFAALLTFCIGIAAASVWANYNSVDKRFAASLRKVYLKSFQEDRSALSVSPRISKIDFDKLEKLLEKKPSKMSDEQLETMKADLKRLKESRSQNSIPAKLPKEYLKDNIDERVAEDIENLNENCRTHSFSEKQCNQLKENSIKDIEENMLSQ